jgi:hypothetical protein
VVSWPAIRSDSATVVAAGGELVQLLRVVKVLYLQIFCHGLSCNFTGIVMFYLKIAFCCNRVPSVIQGITGLFYKLYYD